VASARPSTRADEIILYIDSACTYHHLAPDTTWLTNVRTCNSYVTLADQRTRLHVVAKGDLQGYVQCEHSMEPLTVRNMLVVPDIPSYLLSAEQLEEAGAIVTLAGGRATVRMGGLCALAPKSPSSRLYELTVRRTRSPPTLHGPSHAPHAMTINGTAAARAIPSSISRTAGLSTAQPSAPPACDLLHHRRMAHGPASWPSTPT
jgi:hypothetical protein